MFKPQIYRRNGYQIIEGDKGAPLKTRLTSG